MILTQCGGTKLVALFTAKGDRKGLHCSRGLWGQMPLFLVQRGHFLSASQQYCIPKVKSPTEASQLKHLSYLASSFNTGTNFRAQCCPLA